MENARCQLHTRPANFIVAGQKGSEDFITGGWVRVLASAEQVRKERTGMEQAAKVGLVKIHGSHRGVLLVEFLDVP